MIRRTFVQRALAFIGLAAVPTVAIQQGKSVEVLYERGALTMFGATGNLETDLSQAWKELEPAILEFSRVAVLKGHTGRMSVNVSVDDRWLATVTEMEGSR